MSDSQIRIEIKTLTDVEAVQRTAKEVRGLAEDSKEGGITMERSAVGSTKVLRGLIDTLQGGTRSLRSFGDVLSGLGTILGRAAWLGGLIKAVSIAIEAYRRLSAQFKATSEESEKEAKRIADAYSAATARANQAAEETFAATLVAIKKDADDARRALEGVLRAKVALLDDQEAMALAEIDAKEDLPESERTAAKAEVRRKFRRRRAEEMESGRTAQEDIAARQTAEAQAVVKAAEAEVQAARERARNLRIAEDPEAARRRLKENRRKQSVLNEAARNLFMSAEERARREKARDDNLAKIASDEAIVAQAGEGDAAYLQKREAARAAIQAAIDRRRKAEELAAAAAEAEAALREKMLIERKIAASAEERAQVTDDAPAARLAAQQRETERRAAERETTLAIIGSDRANQAARMAQRVQGSADPAIRDAAKALDQAARAALEGGTTEAEAQALLATLTTFRDALAAQNITSARLMNELATLRQQVASLRNQ